jgi:YD repeat-containing protein
MSHPEPKPSFLTYPNGTQGTFPSWISLDNKRLFRLLGNEGRLLGLEELIWEDHPGTHVVKTDEGCFVLTLSKAKERIRLEHIESHPASKEEDLKERYGLPALSTAALVPRLRYAYSEEGDLIAVYVNDKLKRSFRYKNHLLVYHGVPNGLESHYTYDSYTPEGKVISNRTNTGEIWHFDYREGETRVEDALGRVTVYRYDHDKYFTSKTDPLNQTTTMKYDGQGQLIETSDWRGKTTHYHYDAQTGTLLSTDNGTEKVSYSTIRFITNPSG